MLYFVLCIFFGVNLSSSLAFGQTTPNQSPISCEIKNNVEDATCQEKLKNLITRNGEKLTLRLDKGKSKTYVSNLAACDGESVDVSKCISFNLLTYFPTLRSFLVSKSYYECGDYLFVSGRTGRETILSALPVISPNGKYLLSIDQNDACERKYDIAIWDLKTDPPKLEFKYQAKQYENWDIVAWEDDAHILVKTWINGNPPYDQEAKLLRSTNGWELQFGNRVDHPPKPEAPNQSSSFPATNPGAIPQPKTEAPRQSSPVPAANSGLIQQRPPLPKCKLLGGVPGITCSD
ncbi:hypothetical protein ACQR1I_19715 [Bradyrhizobium sp. HKCCYLS2038]|uniref:hypothetical protein n=1 Tax=Bradyrhizobium sp. HKCCYLS2038 TaxID=3420764 RepID=UPI003EBEF460